MEAISNAGAAIGVLAKDGVVFIAEKKITSKARLSSLVTGITGILHRLICITFWVSCFPFP